MPLTDDARRRAIAASIAFLLVIGTTWCGWRIAMLANGLDYFTFWHVIQTCRSPDPNSDRVEIYGDVAQRRIGQLAEQSLSLGRVPIRQRDATLANLRLYEGRIETTATPFFYAVLSPLVTGDYERDFRIFVAATLLAHVAGVVLVGWVIGYSPLAIAWFVVLLGLPFLPFRSNISVLNVGSLQLLQLSGVLALLSRRCARYHIAAGFLISAAVAFKPTLLPVMITVACALAIDARWRPVFRFMMGCFGGLAVAWITGCLFLDDWHCWQAWVAALNAVLVSQRPMNPWNCSIPMVLKSIFGIDIGSAVLIGLLGVTALLLYRTRLRSSPADKAGDTAGDRCFLAGALGGIFASVAGPLTWAHYHLLVIPLLLWVCHQALQRTRSHSASVLYRTLAAIAFLLLSVVAQSLGLGRRIDELVFANAALLILVGLGWYGIMFEQSAQPPEAASSLTLASG